MTCNHKSIFYSKDDLFFKCKKCGEKLIFCNYDAYRMFCGYVGIPLNQLINKH